MKHHFISLAVIAVVTIAFNLAYCSSQQAKANEAELKPVCIEAHLNINPAESMVICGKLVSL